MYEQLYVGFYGTEPLPENTGVGLYYREEAGVHVLAAFQARQQDRMKYPPNWPVPPEDWSWVACVPPAEAGTVGNINLALTVDSSLDPHTEGWQPVVIPPKLISWQDYLDEQNGDDGPHAHTDHLGTGVADAPTFLRGARLA